jgi:hypothetical protein
MSNLIPSSGTNLTPTAGRSDRRLNRELTILERRTLVRMANVQAEAMVQGEKLHEVDHLCQEAMTGQALLGQWAATLAHGDPMVADELAFFAGMARVAKGQIIADTVTTFSRSR